MDREDEQIAKLNEINQLLREALEKCRALLNHHSEHPNATGQDNDPYEDMRRES